MLLLSIALFATFLLLLAGLAFAGFKASCRVGRDGRGSKNGGCLPGCFLGCGLLVLGFLGLAGLLAMLLAVGADRAVRHGPIERVGLLRQGDPVRAAPTYPLNLRFEVRGAIADWVESDMAGLIRGICECEPDITTRRSRDDEGRELLVLDVALPASNGDMRRLQAEIDRRVPGLADLQGVEIEFRGADL